MRRAGAEEKEWYASSTSKLVGVDKRLYRSCLFFCVWGLRSVSKLRCVYKFWQNGVTAFIYVFFWSRYSSIVFSALE